MNLSNLFTSGFSFNHEEYELKLKYTLFNFFLLFNILLVSLTTIFRFSNTQYTQAFFDLIYVILGLITFFIARKSKKYFYKLVITVISYSLILIAIAYYGVLNPITGISWFIVLMMTTFFLLGNKAGTTVFFLSLILIIIIATNKHYLSSSQISIGVIPFLVALAFMYFFEKRNQNFKKQIARASCRERVFRAV